MSKNESEEKTEIREPLDRIKSTLAQISETTEYKILDVFSKLAYVTLPFNYRVFDKSKGEDVVRELDFFCLKFIAPSQEDIKKLPKGTPLEKVVGSLLKSTLSFIGDVKYYPEDRARIFVGLTPSKFQMEDQKVSEIMSHTMNLLSFSRFFPSEYKFNKLKLLNITASFFSKFPVCNKLIIFDKKGNRLERMEKEDEKSKKGKVNKRIKSSEKFNMFNYCKQVSSGFSHVKKNEEIIKSSFIIPLIVFGHNVEFIVGHPDDIMNDKFGKPKAIYYLFQSSDPPANIFLPILLTSLPVLQEVILSIEASFQKGLERKLITL